MSATQTLTIRIAGDISEALAGLNEIGVRAQKFSREITRTGRTLTRNFTAPIVGAGLAAFAAGVRVGNTADQLLDLEQQTGITTDTLQEFRRVATVAGVDQDTMAEASQALTRRLREAGEMSGRVQETLRRLGVSTRDSGGELRAMDEMLPEIIQRLQSMGNTVARNSLANEIFGSRAMALAPILGMTADEFENARREAHELGLVLGRDALDGANDFRKQLGTLTESAKGIANELGVAVIPVAKDFVELVQREVVPLVRSAVEWFGKLDPATLKVAAGVAAVAASIGPLVLAGGKLLKIFGLLLTPAGLVTAALTSIAFTALTVVRNWDVLRLQTTLAWTAIRSVVFSAVDGLLGAIERLTSFIPGLGAQVSRLRENFNRFADESLAKSGRRIVELEREINSNAAAVRELGGDVAQAGNIFNDFGGNVGGAESALARIFRTLRGQTGLAEALTVLQLPGADEGRAKIQAYETALRALLREGLDPADERVVSLAERIRELTAAQEAAASSAEELSRMQREAEAVISSLLTPLQVHEAHMARLGELLEAGKLEQDQYNQAVARAQAAYERATPAGERMQELLAAQARILEDIQTPMERYSAHLELLEELLQRGMLSQEEFNRALGRARSAFEELEDPVSAFGDAVRGQLQRSTDAVINFSTTSRNSIKQFVVQALADLARLAARMLMVRALSGTLLGPAGLLAGGMIPARALGGPVRAHRPHLVGERGPELFIPPASGTVVPNQHMAAAGGGGVNFDFSGFPRATNPLAAARDDQWQTFLRDSLRLAGHDGFDPSR